MFFKSNNININQISNKVYDEFLIKNDVLYKIITDEKLFKLDNVISYTFFSFVFHIYFFRILLLSKYSDKDIQKIFAICLNKAITPINADLNKKEEIIDNVYEIFSMLDVFMQEIKTSTNKEYSVSMMQEIAKYFIELVIKDEEDEQYNSLAILKIVNYFTYLLSDKEILSRIEG